MRVFVFFLMMAVAVGGLLGGYRVITGRNLVSLSDLGVGRVDAQAASVASTPRAATPSPVSTVPPLPTVAPSFTATPVPEKTQVMVVANTDGQGAFVRRTPKLDDKLRPWVEGTKMDVTGRGIEGDGKQWFKVRAPDGVEGYIPQEFLAPAQ